jgi:hypothetical protein
MDEVLCVQFHAAPLRVMFPTKKPGNLPGFIICPIGRVTSFAGRAFSLLLGAFGVRRFRMLTRVLRVLLGLGSVLFALGMVILAMSLGRGAMGLCSGLMKFRRLVVFVFHVVFSC